ncbi:F0F1 ATP synthase subunit A [Candidatus Saccharibacteria bacterium]|nr:MAG: F0F1 ATP synthase subunit A [Candidatus Saccharibacteria bacterium]
MLLGGFSVTVLLDFFLHSIYGEKGQTNRFVGLVQWAFEGMYKAVYDIVPDRVMARSIAPLALTIFFTVLISYWADILPGVGHSISWHGGELLRSLPTDLNFTIALAITSMTAVQFYAVKQHGFLGNAKRYVISPLKNPIGAFEGFLELIGEFSRLIALSLRLFGNAFAGAALLAIVAGLASYAASAVLPFFMAFELFIGFIQAYVFYVLTLIFASLATASHGGSHDTAHDSAKTKEVAAA